MGYGGTGYATVTVDIVQADVQAIVDGITGTYGRTLTNVDDELGIIQSYLDGSNFGPISLCVNTLSWIDMDLVNIQGYLYNWTTMQSAAQLLADIRDILQQLTFDGSGRLRTTTA